VLLFQTFPLAGRSFPQSVSPFSRALSEELELPGIPPSPREVRKTSFFSLPPPPLSARLRLFSRFRGCRRSGHRPLLSISEEEFSLLSSFLLFSSSLPPLQREPRFFFPCFRPTSARGLPSLSARRSGYECSSFLLLPRWRYLLTFFYFLYVEAGMSKPIPP